MDQKKTLWIIAAVGAFLLVVLGAAYIMYPKAPTVEQTITRNLPDTRREPASNDDGWITPPAPVTVPNELAVNELTVFSENTNVYSFDDSNKGTTIDLNALKNDLITQAPVVPSTQDINITVQIKDPEPVAKVTEPSNDYYVEKSEPKKVVKASSEPKTEAPAPAAKTTAKTASGKSVTVTAKTSAPATKTQYWVQVAAYSSKKGAEAARAVLEENKITADIFTYKDNKDKLYYRVRVGPYTTKSEAEYWKSKIVKIETFAKAESYITSTQTQLD